ncbi:neprilysin-3-like [Amblyomma americanum]
MKGVDASVWVTAVKDANPGGVTISAESECFAKAFTAIRNAFRELTAVGVRRAASYLAANLEAEVAFLEDARQNLKEDAAAKRRFCLELTRRSVALTWHPLAARILHSAAHEASVRGMFGALRDVLGRNSVAFTFLDPEVRAAALNRLNGTALILIDEEMAQQVNASYEKFMPVIAEAKDFVSGYVSALKETQWLQTVSPPSRLQALCASMELAASIEYKPWLRSIVVPPMLLAEPYFYGKALPLHFNYGTVGSLLASRVAEVLGADNPQTGGTNGTGREGDPRANGSRWSEQSVKRYRKSVECLRDLHARLGSAAGASGPQRKHINVLLAWAQGLRVAYEALLTWFTTVAGDSDRFQHHWHAAQVLFFARFCLLSCSADRRPTAAVPGRDRCLVPLHNMRQFAETFECGGAKGFVTASCPL